MNDKNNLKITTPTIHKKMPLDAHIMGWLVLASSILCLLYVSLLLSGLATIAPGYNHLILFGTVVLDSELSFVVYLSLNVLTGLASGYGIIKGYKFGWWLLLISSIIGFSEVLTKYFQHPIRDSIGICMFSGIIVWLIYRRRLYNIGKKTSKSESHSP